MSVPDTTRQDTVRSSEYFAILPEWVLYHPDLSSNAVRLFACLQRHASNQTQKAWPSRPTLAKSIGKSRNTVDRCLTELIDAGALKKRHRKTSNGDYTSNEYTLMMSPPVGRGSPKNGATGSPNDGATVAPPVVNESESVDTEPIEPENIATLSQMGDPPTPTKQQRDAIWDTLVDLFGEPSPGRQSLYGKQTKWLAEQQATPDSLQHVARWIVARWDIKALTINSIVDHYNSALHSTVGQITPGASDVWNRGAPGRAVAEAIRAQQQPKALPE